jgi:hypothetical protein
MKKITIILVFSLFFISCLIDEDFIREGFQTNYFNDTNQTYTGKIIIGGFKNNLFVATDSINFERAIESNRQTIMFTDANRWKPDLDKIRNLPSARCYFKIQLSDGRNQLITRYNSSELTSLQIPNTTHFRGDFGRIFISIRNDQISGSAVKEE